MCFTQDLCFNKSVWHFLGSSVLRIVFPVKGALSEKPENQAGGWVLIFKVLTHLKSQVAVMKVKIFKPSTMTNKSSSHPFFVAIQSSSRKKIMSTGFVYILEELFHFTNK